MFSAEETWSYAQSDVDLNEHISTLEGEDFTNLSEENLRTLTRSFSETLRQRKSHLNLLFNLKDCQNKDQLVEELQEGIHSLEHDIKCLGSELEGRKLVKSRKSDEFIFPTVTDNDNENLDLTLLKQLIGPNFDGENKLMFKSQYDALVHYSKSTPLNVRQLNQIFTLMLKGQALQYYTSLDPSLPLKTKIKNLLTVYSYRSSIGDRLRDLECFERKPFEALDSVYLRLSSILDSTASLISPASRVGRSEHVLSHAIYSLSLPAAKHRLAKFRSERTSNGQFLTSKELLRAAIRFEEGLPNNRGDSVPLSFKDPFINPGEVSKEGKRAGIDVNPPSTSGMARHSNEDMLQREPVPLFWADGKKPSAEEDLKNDIKELSHRIDQLSKSYNEKLQVSANANAAAAETHAVDEEPVSNPKPALGTEPKLTDTFLTQFLHAQYNFYKNFDYASAPEPKNPSYLRYAKWGSNYVKEMNPDQFERGFEGRRYGGGYPSQRSPPTRSFGFGRQPENYDNSSRTYGTMPKDFRSQAGNNSRDTPRRFPQPKRLRFSEYLRRQNSSGSEGSSGALTPQNESMAGGRNNGRMSNDGNHVNGSHFDQSQRGSKRQLDVDNMGPSHLRTSDRTVNSTGHIPNAPLGTGFQPMPPIKNN